MLDLVLTVLCESEVNHPRHHLNVASPSVTHLDLRTSMYHSVTDFEPYYQQVTCLNREATGGQAEESVDHP